MWADPFVVHVPVPAFAKSRPVIPWVRTAVLPSFPAVSNVKDSGTAALVFCRLTLPKFTPVAGVKCAVCDAAWKHKTFAAVSAS